MPSNDMFFTPSLTKLCHLVETLLHGAEVGTSIHDDTLSRQVKGQSSTILDLSTR
jgi:hypothetical protein